MLAVPEARVHGCTSRAVDRLSAKLNKAFCPAALGLAPHVAQWHGAVLLRRRSWVQVPPCELFKKHTMEFVTLLRAWPNGKA